MGSRLTGVVVAGVAALMLAASASAVDAPAPEPLGQAVAAPSWAAPQITAVVAAGLMGPDVASFRPDEPLTRGELHAAIRRAREAAPRAARSHAARHDARARRTARRSRRPPAVGARRSGSPRATRGSSRSTCSAPRPSRGSSVFGSTIRPAASTWSARRKSPRRVPRPHTRSRSCWPSRPGASRSIQQLAAGFACRRSPTWQRAISREGASLRRLPVRLLGHVGEDAEALERDGAREARSRCPAASTARGSSGGSTSSSRTRRLRFSRRCPQGPDDVRDERRGRAAAARRSRRRSRPATSSSSGARARSRSRSRSGTPGSTSATAGSSTRRAAV